MKSAESPLALPTNTILKFLISISFACTSRWAFRRIGYHFIRWSRKLSKVKEGDVFLKIIIKLGVFILLLSILTACSDIKEMLKRDLEIERRRAVADSRNNPY